LVQPHPSRERAAGRVLGLDPGQRWIGVAVSDDDRRLALPLCTIDRRQESDDGAALIAGRLGLEGATLAVVGVPLRPDGADDEQSLAFRALGTTLAQRLDLPTEFVSERFSNPIGALTPPPPTKVRGRRRSARGTGQGAAQHKKRRMEEHAVAAANILQRWLDGQASASGLPERQDA
jgi:RNase H-fold protein (predicted Holliday junction resolvase)